MKRKRIKDSDVFLLSCELMRRRLKAITSVIERSSPPPTHRLTTSFFFNSLSFSRPKIKGNEMELGGEKEMRIKKRLWTQVFGLPSTLRFSFLGSPRPLRVSPQQRKES
jgi:hypothetical protein